MVWVFRLCGCGLVGFGFGLLIFLGLVGLIWCLNCCGWYCLLFWQGWVVGLFVCCVLFSFGVTADLIVLGVVRSFYVW